jgi:hypothetical protein
MNTLQPWRKQEEDWKALRTKIIDDITTIDGETVGNGSMVEPQWWLDMMDVRRLLQKQINYEKNHS